MVFEVCYGRDADGEFAMDWFEFGSVGECAAYLSRDRANCSKRFLWDYCNVSSDDGDFTVLPDGEVV